jgi:hypothetical protein
MSRVSMPRSRPEISWKMADPPRNATSMPSDAVTRRYPCASATRARPAAEAAIVALGWMAMPSLSQSASCGTSKTHPAKEIRPPMSAYSPDPTAHFAAVVMPGLLPTPVIVTFVSVAPRR